MSTTEKIFKHQIWHLISLLALICAVQIYITNNPGILRGSYWSVSTSLWFWLAIVIPVVHQTYVLLVWRFELYKRIFTTRFGLKKAFQIYAAGFSLLFVSRLVVIVFLAISSKNSLQTNPGIAYVIALLITPVVLFLFYSVKKHFTFERAFGIDHFDKNYCVPFVKKGIFKYTDNGMYVFGLMVLYLPGLLLLSEAALLAALFNHAYIWAHYYFTERPDMVEIYGDTP